MQYSHRHYLLQCTLDQLLINMMILFMYIAQYISDQWKHNNDYVTYIWP